MRNASMVCTLVVSFGLAALPDGSSGAQVTEPRDTTPQPRGLCWAARPLPACRNLLITDAGLFFPIASPHFRDFPEPVFSTHYSLTLGLLHNTNPRTAWGATVSFITDGDTELRAWMVRRRWWFADRRHIDLSAGYLQQRASSPSFRVDVGTGVSGQVRFAPLPYLALNGRVDWLHSNAGGNAFGAFGGVDVAGPAGPVVSAAGVLVLLVMALSVLSQST